MAIKKKFESEIHFGFLGIICLLLLLNFMSNLIIYKIRSLIEEDQLNSLNHASLSISRNLKNNSMFLHQEDDLNRLNDRFGLAEVRQIDGVPPLAENNFELREWQSALVGSFGIDRLKTSMKNLIKSKPYQLVPGDSSKFYYLYPTTSRKLKKTLLLTVVNRELAYLDNSRYFLSYVMPGALIITLIIYLLISRQVFSPFRKIKAEAIAAGRLAEIETDDVNKIVEEYRVVIEKLKQSEAELKQYNVEIQSKADSLEQLNEHILRSSKTGILILNCNGLIISYNNSIRKFISHDDKLKTNNIFTDLFNDEQNLTSSDSITSIIKSALEKQHYPEFLELEIDKQDTMIRKIAITISPIQNREHKLLGISIWLHDISEIERLRRELEQRRRLSSLGEMAAGLAHQIRNSIGAISGYSNLIKKRLENDEISLTNVTSLQKEVSEAEDMIGKFLNLSKPLNINKERLNLFDFLIEIIESCQLQKKYDNVEFSVKCDDSITTELDSSLIKQAIVNLLNNSVNASHNKKPLIEIEAKETVESISLIITDHGSGIPKDELKNIFTPFYSSHPSGSGLGLPFVQKIVEIHNGQISLHSEVGRGTTIKITFPKEKSQNRNEILEKRFG